MTTFQRYCIFLVVCLHLADGCITKIPELKIEQPRDPAKDPWHWCPEECGAHTTCAHNISKDSWKNSQELEKRCARYKWCWWWNKVVDEHVYYEKFIPAVQIKRTKQVKSVRSQTIHVCTKLAAKDWNKLGHKAQFLHLPYVGKIIFMFFILFRKVFVKSKKMRGKMVDIPGSHWWDEFWWNDRTWRGHLRLKVRHDAPDDEIYPESEEFRFTRKHRKWEHYAYYHYDEWFMEEDPNEGWF